MASIQTDFCVVGGGPAGLTLALLLVRSGAKVVVIERSGSFDREYRGEILQPGGMRLLDELGVLGNARERGSHEHDRFLLIDRGRTLIESDYRRLPAPYNFLLSIPQRHILEELLAQCRRYDGFTYIDGGKVSDLVREEGRITGTVSVGRGGMHHVLAHCVIGADGRYSKVRRLAGIDDGRLDLFDHDVLWFKLSFSGAAPRDVQIYRAAGNPALIYTSFPDSVQVGWTLPHRRYGSFAEKGIDHIKGQIAAALPGYAELIDSELTSLRDLTLLDVFAARAPEWVRDGLVLIGDSAHTHSPIGAQGINLAIQDAVVLHPILMDSLRAKDASARFLARFPAARKPDIDRIMRIQAMQSKAMLSSGGLASAVRPRLAGLVSRTRLYDRILDQIAFGGRNVRISTEFFIDDYLTQF